jgi:hypothetical protein
VAVTVAFLGLALAYFATPYSAFGGEGQPVLASASTATACPRCWPRRERRRG